MKARTINLLLVLFLLSMIGGAWWFVSEVGTDTILEDARTFLVDVVAWIGGVVKEGLSKI